MPPGRAGTAADRSAGPRLRLAGRTDAAAIAALSRDRIEHGLGWRWTAARVQRAIADAQTNVVVATASGGPPSGFGIMKYDDEEAHLLLLAVALNASRQGLGRALVGWLEASARVAGIARIGLEARQSNRAARAFYGGLGYRETAVLPGYYGGVEACVRFSKALRSAPVEPG